TNAQRSNTVDRQRFSRWRRVRLAVDSCTKLDIKGSSNPGSTHKGVNMGVSRLAMAGALVLLVSSVASAQGTSAIAGVVRDTSGAVLPGVTVEASSPALIEKTRTVVTDSEGQYKILDLPGGTYAVTFSLTGFSTIKRDGLVLTA